MVFYELHKNKNKTKKKNKNKDKNKNICTTINTIMGKNNN